MYFLNGYFAVAAVVVVVTVNEYQIVFSVIFKHYKI